jgi:hypothetical protein
MKYFFFWQTCLNVYPSFPITVIPMCILPFSLLPAWPVNLSRWPITVTMFPYIFPWQMCFFGSSLRLGWPCIQVNMVVKNYQIFNMWENIFLVLKRIVDWPVTFSHLILYCHLNTYPKLWFLKLWYMYHYRYTNNCLLVHGLKKN